ncbi:phylloplanin [Quercus suber]|uniref:Phylloplanin n=1 Tax=Quercus suber TaxID=58331 RepID=A0AAW0KDH1_QUESU
MALKLVLFVSVMVAALALPIAKAQLSINPSIGLGVVLQVQPSFVPCSLGANVTAKYFNLTIVLLCLLLDAQVQLQCGVGNVVASNTTNGSGIFSLSVDFARVVISATVRLSNCNLVVVTHLSTCNATLPAVGVLQSTIQFVRTDVLIGRVVFIYRPVGFRYISST